MQISRHEVGYIQTDIHEIKEDEELSSEDKKTFEQIVEMSGSMLAVIVHMVTKEMKEEEFLLESIVMDEIDRHLNEI